MSAAVKKVLFGSIAKQQADLDTPEMKNCWLENNLNFI